MLHWKGLLSIARASRLYRLRPRARLRGHGELLKLLRISNTQSRASIGGGSSTFPPRSFPAGRTGCHLSVRRTSMTWDSSRTVVVIKQRRTSALSFKLLSRSSRSQAPGRAPAGEQKIHRVSSVKQRNKYQKNVLCQCPSRSRGIPTRGQARAVTESMASFGPFGRSHLCAT